MLVRCLVTFVLLVAPLLGVAATGTVAVAVLQPWEHGGAQIQLSQVRTLAQRLSKENLLYQLGLADVQKSDLVKTAEELDAALTALRKGSPSLAVPAPPGKGVSDAIEALDAAWGPLRRLALASPFDYARRERGVGSGADPLLLRHFDDLAQALDDRAAAAKQSYVAECERAGGPNCQSVASATNVGPLSERMVKEAVLVFSGFDADANTKRLLASHDKLGQVLELAEALEPVQAAMSPERGRVGEAVGGVWGDVGGNWKRLSGEVSLVLAGQRDQLDVSETVAAQKALLRDVQRFAVAVQRFSVGRRVLAGGPS